MWIKTTAGNHYGLYEITGIELYQESDTSFILYGYLPRPVPEIPVRTHESLRDGMTHIDFVKIHQFTNEFDAISELNKIQDFLNHGASGVYEVTPRLDTGMPKSA